MTHPFRDVATKDTLVIDEFAGDSKQAAIQASMFLPCRKLVLRMSAKELFSYIMADVLSQQYEQQKARQSHMFDHFNRWDYIIGYAIASWDEDDPTYLGMGASRVWFGRML